MIEFGVILGAGVLALTLALFLGRPLLSRSTKLRLVTSAHGTVFASTRNFLRTFDQALAVLTALVTFFAFVGVAVVRDHTPQDPTETSYALAGWIVVSLLLGALSSALATHLASHAMTRSAPRIDEAAKRGAADFLREGIRSAGAATLALGSILLLSFTSLALAAVSLSGGLTDAPSSSNPTRAMVALVSSYALGTVITAIASHTVGGVFVASCASLAHDNAPLLNKVRIHLNVAVSRVPDLFASMATSLVAASILSVTSLETSYSGSPIALALGPAIALTLSVLASTIGIFVVTTDEHENVTSALDRGLAVTILLSTASFVGLTQWLFDHIWWRMLLSAFSGLLGAVVLVVMERIFALRHASSNGCDDASRTFDVSGLGFQRASLLGTVALLSVLGGFIAGRSSGADQGGIYGLSLAVLGMISPAPFVLTTAAFGAMVTRHLHADCQDAHAPKTPSQRKQDQVRSRLALVDVGSLCTVRSYAATCTTASAWVAAVALSSVFAIYGSKLSAIEINTWELGSVGVAVFRGWFSCSGYQGQRFVPWREC